MKIAYIGIKGLTSKGGAERVVEAIVRRLATQHVLTEYCSQNYTAPNDKFAYHYLRGIEGIELTNYPYRQGHPMGVDQEDGNDPDRDNG